jgi:hypothetical protein
MTKHEHAIALITPSQIAQAKSQLEKVTAVVASTPGLSPAERQRTAKPHRGAQVVVSRVAHLASQYGLEVSAMNEDDLVALMDNANRLRDLLAAVEGLRRSLKDAILRSESTAWRPTVAAYSALLGMAKARPEIRTSLADVESWFRPRRATKRQGPVPAPNGEAATQ